MVFGNAIAELIRRSDEHHPLGISKIGGLAIPSQGLGFVLGHALADIVGQADVNHRRAIFQIIACLE